jgi:hypothetical protein
LLARISSRRILVCSALNTASGLVGVPCSIAKPVKSFKPPLDSFGIFSNKLPLGPADIFT